MVGGTDQVWRLDCAHRLERAGAVHVKVHDEVGQSFLTEVLLEQIDSPRHECRAAAAMVWSWTHGFHHFQSQAIRVTHDGPVCGSGITALFWDGVIGLQVIEIPTQSIKLIEDRLTTMSR